MNQIERTIGDINKVWLAGFRAGVEVAAKAAKEYNWVPDVNVQSPSEHQAKIVSIIRSLLNESDQDVVDEDEPDRYLDEIPESEDERLDDPRHGQAEGLNWRR